MTYYQKHIFVCAQQKAPGKVCCGVSGGDDFFDYLKSKLLEMGLHGPGKFRLSKTGCLGRCHSGPGIVIYPEGKWYTYTSFADLDEIISHDLVGGESVKHLLMNDLS